MVKSAAGSTAQRVPAQRLLHSLCPRQIRQRQARRGAQPDRGIGIALRREPDHRRQHRRAAGQGANCWRCSTPFCSTHTTVSGEHRAVSRGRWPPSGWFSPRQRPVEGGGYRHRVGVHRAGHHDLTLVSAQHQRRMGGTPADHRRPPPSQTGRRQSWCRWRRDQLAQP